MRKFDKILTVLRAMKRAETARLKAKLNEASTARMTARELRDASASLSTLATANEMRFQSNHQQFDEAQARQLEHEASIAEQEAGELQSKLALTLGRQQAAETLADSAAATERAVQERRAESVPTRGRNYLSSSSEGSSVGTE